MVAYLKATPDKKTYSDYLCAAQEAEKGESMEPSCSYTGGSPAKPKATSFFHLRKQKGNQSTKTPVVWLAHLEEEAPDDDEGTDSKDPDGLDGIMKEFMMGLARAIKNAHQDEKHCYHWSSLDPIIRDCPLVKLARKEPCLHCKEGMALKKGACIPLGKVTWLKVPQDGMP